MSNPITIKEILARKEQLKSKKQSTITLYVESLDANIVIQEPSRQFALEALEMAQDPNRNDKADAYIVYNCVVSPDLKSAELQKGLGVVDPLDIVDMLFKAGEVASISGHCLQLAGYGNGLKKVDGDLKN